MNIFDKLPSLAKSKDTHRDELGIYLTADIENVSDPLQWWYDHQPVYPRLACMAIDYLTIPGV